MDVLQRDYPWTKAPLVANGPMRLIALAPLAVAVSRAGGLGFLGAGSDVSSLARWLAEVEELRAQSPELQDIPGDVCPVGIGFLLWAGPQLLADALPSLAKHKPAAVWLFAHRHIDEAVAWTTETRRVTAGRTKIWIQVGTVAEALEATRACQPDVLVIQGQDAGGHGLLQAAGLVPLMPEADDAVTALCATRSDLTKPVLLAAGGIMEGRGAAAALALGAAGVVLGTRYLAAPEANVAPGYRAAVLTAADGGINTARGTLYDSLRGTTDWPERYGGRGVLNESWHDAAAGMAWEENKRLYDEALARGDAGWGPQARLTTYAGAGVGLAGTVHSAAEITEEVREDAKKFLRKAAATLVL